MTNASGAAVSTVEPDPWGAATPRDSNAAFQPRRFTTYDRDADGSDEAMMRRYDRRHSRFSQPDPSAASYYLSDPQSLNRYSYVNNDPANFVDPTGLLRLSCEAASWNYAATTEGARNWFIWQSDKRLRGRDELMELDIPATIKDVEVRPDGTGEMVITSGDWTDIS